MVALSIMLWKVPESEYEIIHEDNLWTKPRGLFWWYSAANFGNGPRMIVA